MKNKATALILLMTSSLYVTNANITASLPAMVEEFSAVPGTEFLVKMALTLPSLFIALIAPVSGAISDRFGRKKILTISLIIYGIGGFSGFILKDLRLILLGRALLGLGLGTLLTTTSALIGDNFTGIERRKILSLQGAFVSLGGLVFVGGSGFLAGLSWKYPFILYLVSFLILPAALVILKEPLQIQKLESKPKLPSPKNSSGIIIFINFSVFLSMIFFLMIHTQLPFLLKGFNRDSTSLMGVLLIVLNLVGFFSASSYMRVRNKLSHITIYGLYFILMGLGFYFLGSTGGNLTLFIGIIICGSAAGLTVPNTSVWLQDITMPHSRGKIMGIMTASTFLGQFLSPVIMQPVLKILPDGMLFPTVGIFMITLGILYGVLNILLKVTLSQKRTSSAESI